MLLEHAINNIPVALLIINEDKNLVEANSQAFTWFERVLSIGDNITDKFLSTENTGFINILSGVGNFQLGTSIYRYTHGIFEVNNTKFYCVSVFNDTEQHQQLLNAQNIANMLRAAQHSKDAKRKKIEQPEVTVDDFEAKCMEGASIGLNSDHNGTMISISNQGVITQMSSNNFRGYTKEELVGQVSYNTVHPDDVKKISSKVKNILLSASLGTPVLLWFRKRHKNGTYVHTEFSGSLQENVNGHCAFYGIERVLSTQRMETVVQSVLNQIPCGVIMVDTVSGNIDMCNHHASNWFNIRKDNNFIECLYKLKHHTFGDLECNKLISFVKTCHFEMVDTEGNEITVRTKQGRILCFIGRGQNKNQGSDKIASGSSSSANKTQPSSVLWIVNDITVLTKAMEEKNDAILQFMRCTSHDMRTPMQAIVLASHSIKEELSHECIQYDVETIISSSAVLDSIVSNILEFKTISSTEVEPKLTHIDVKKRVEQLVDILSHSTLVSDKVELSASFVNMDPDQLFESDSKLLDRIILNLASNSLKFTTVGKVEVNCWIETDNGDDSFTSKSSSSLTSTSPTTSKSLTTTLCIVVRDTGRGMDEKSLLCLGEIGFLSGDNSGFGLGTYIVKSYVEVLKGKINVESEVGVGTITTLRLPTSVMSKPSLVISTNDEEQQITLSNASQGSLVLVVEDVTINRRLLVRFLEKGGFIVEQAENGAIALEMMLMKKYRTVFMDINMPVMNGDDAIRQYWQLATHAEHPRFYVLTGNIFDADRQKAISCGAHEFLTKPIDPKKVIGFARWS